MTSDSSTATRAGRRRKVAAALAGLTLLLTAASCGKSPAESTTPPDSKAKQTPDNKVAVGTPEARPEAPKPAETP